MPDRLILHVVPDANSWKVEQEGTGETLVLVDNKDNAVQQAKDLAKAAPLGQVIVHTRDGKIAEEYTYGEDPPQSPG